MTAPLIAIEGLKTYFHTEEGVVKAVDDLSIEILEGQTLGLVGESGSGKSVTSLSIMRLAAGPRHAEVGSPSGLGSRGSRRGPGRCCRTREMSQRSAAAKISMIFQEPMTSLNPVFRFR